MITIVVLGVVVLGTFCYLNRRELIRQWAAYRVGSAATFEEAQAEIAWFETGPDRDAKLRELVRKWGTGNRQFDLYLAQHVGHADSSEALRKAFSLELTWREELLPRWAHYWSWRSTREPEQQIASIVAHLDLLISTDASETITWREVLDLQAVFHLTGQPRLAKRLSPENWKDRYRGWLEAGSKEPVDVQRPLKPFPDGRFSPQE